jgi:acyl-CoA hydrolase
MFPPLSVSAELLMDTYTHVRPEHLNHLGTLFGGQLLKWVDEAAWLAAAREFPHLRLVTRAMDRVSFERRVVSGATLRFCVQRQAVGRTSVTYNVIVHSQAPGCRDEETVFETSITFVNVDERLRKAPVESPD